MVVCEFDCWVGWLVCVLFVGCVCECGDCCCVCVVFVGVYVVNYGWLLCVVCVDGVFGC